MSAERFELVKMILELVLYVLSAMVVPAVFLFIRQRTTREQRKDVLYWTDFAVNMAERIYKDRGMGPIKKDFVLSWLRENGVFLSESQADFVIDMIVAWYNSVDWELELLGGELDGRLGH